MYEGADHPDIWRYFWFLQSVHHQELDDKPLRFFAEVRKHALLKRHVVVPDVQGCGSVILPSERGHASQAETQTLL